MSEELTKAAVSLYKTLKEIKANLREINEQLCKVGEQQSESKKLRKSCDFEGTCTNCAYVEVYPSVMGKKYKGAGWCYLCRKHLEQEKKRFKNKLPYTYI